MRIAITLILVWSLTVSPALAWNATGHKIIASIAFRQLTPAEQAKIVAMLKRHPRFIEDFADQMPEEVRGADEATQNEWLFQQAAVWPDMVRSGPPETRAFNRGEWHYVNLPIYLNDVAQAQLDGKLTANVATEPPAGATVDTARMNIVQVIRYARKEVADTQTIRETRALLLAWLFHDVGDIHQPLHSSALYSTKLFHDGDRGGNSIKTRQADNLHSLWDHFPGSDDSLRGVRNRVIATLADAELARLGDEAATILDETAWLNESHVLAKSAAYDDELLTGLRKMEVAGKGVEEVALGEAYLKAGGVRSGTRLVQAGYRLGAVLKRITTRQ
jgi:hypothetical protein